MGKRGPPKTPTQVLKKRGSNLRGSRSRKGEAKASAIKPAEMPAPTFMRAGGTAMECYRELESVLAPMGLLTAADRMALGLLADAMHDYVVAREIVDAEGLAHETRSGGKMLSPEVRAMRAAWDCVMKAAREFGLTPSARSGIVVQKPEEAKDDKRRFFVREGSA